MLSGDHVYKMDYAKMLRFHRERGAGATLAVLEIASEEASRFGVLEVDGEDRLTGFLEKPQAPAARPDGPCVDGHLHLRHERAGARRSRPTRRGQRRTISARTSFPDLISKVPVYAYRFYDENKKAGKYWRDIGTLDAYFDANMDLCHVNPDFNLYDPEWPLRTDQVQAPPAKFVFADDGRRCGQALDSIISAGCIISGSRVSGSVLCPNVRVHSFCEVDQSILMPGVRVGRHARIRRAIIDRDVFIPRGARIGYNADEDRSRHTVTDSGIVVVTTEDQPFVGEIPEEALRNEAEFDRRGT